MRIDLDKMKEGKDRRKFPRAFANVRISVKVTSEALKGTPKKPTWTTIDVKNKGYAVNEVKNISAGGAYFQLGVSVSLGSLVSLDINFVDANKTIQCNARVRRVEPVLAIRQYNWAVEYTQIESADKEWLLRYGKELAQKKSGFLSKLFHRRR